MFIRRERFGWLSHDPIEQKPLILETSALPDGIEELYDVIESSTAYDAFLSAPISLYVYPTMKCNKNCAHCYFRGILNRDSLVMKERTVNRIIKQVGKYGIFTVNILGGEPLLPEVWPVTERLLRELLAKDVEVNVTSNGLKLQHCLAQLRCLKKEYPDLLCLNISFNAGDESMLYGRELLKTMDEIACFGPMVNLNTVVLDHDLSKYAKIIEIMGHNNSVNRLNLLYPRVVNPPSISRYIDFCNELANLIGTEKINIETPFAHIYNGSEIDDTVFSHFHYGCGLGKRSLAVAPDSSVHACSKVVSGSDFHLGDIHEDLIVLWDRAYHMRTNKDLKLVANKCRNKCRYYGICESCLADKQAGVNLLCEYAEKI